MITVSCLVISSCTPISFLFNFLPEAETETPRHVLQANEDYEVVWEFSNIRVDSNDRRPMIVSSPGKIIFEGWKDEKSLVLTAVDSLSGDVLWQKQIHSSSGDIISQDTALYRGTYGAAEIQAYNADTGDFVWKKTLPWAHSVVELYDTTDRIFVFTADNNFFILNAQGEIIEKRHETFRTFLETGDKIFREKNYNFELIDTLTQKSIWSTKIGKRFTHSPIFNNGNIYLRTWAIPTEIYSLDASTGTVNWKVTQDIVSNLCILKDKIYFLTSDGYLMAIDKMAGKEISKVRFLPSFDLEKQIGGYFVSADSLNNVLAVSFGDNTQIMGLKITNP